MRGKKVVSAVKLERTIHSKQTKEVVDFILGSIFSDVKCAVNKRLLKPSIKKEIITEVGKAVRYWNRAVQNDELYG